MAATGYRFPDYVHYKRKSAALDETEPDFDLSVLDSREKVWLSAIKLACTPMRPLERNLFEQKTASAAVRYGIEPDIRQAVEFVGRLEKRKDRIRDRDDFQKAAAWLDRYAGQLAPDVRAALASHLLEETVKVGHVPSLSEKFQWDQWAGRDPYTEEIREFAQRNLHKLATGNVYTSDQFSCLSVEEIRDCLPDLLKTASLGMDVIEPSRFGKTAGTLPEHEARILDELLASHGQTPVHSEFGAPIVIDDTILSSL